MNDPAARPRKRRFVYWLLALPCVATLFPQLYARAEPSLFGIPFFYWYLIAWTLGCGVVTGAVYFFAREGET
jgi:hypothetical protein